MVFSNPEIQKLLKEKFIPVTCDDWYQRRRKDAEGEFFRKVANQGPRKGQGGSTRQGHYVFTAGGKLLGYNNNRGADRRLAMIKQSLKKWQALPAFEKTAEVPKNLTPDRNFHRALPQGGTIIKVHARALEKNDGKLVAMAKQQRGSQASIDHLWLTQQEVGKLHQLVKQGGGVLPPWFTRRLARFYLVDGTRGEPPFWHRNELDTLNMQVDKTGAIKATFLLQTKDQSRGFEAKGQGRIQFNSGGKLTRFQLLVLGNHWGEGRYTRGARPGKTPLGFVFQLNNGKRPQDRIPPQAIRWAKGYWQAEDH